MTSIPIHELIPVLQVAIGPVILISGVGLLLLTLTNRFGRAVDRSRALGRELRENGPADGQRLSSQVSILFLRAKVIRLSIIMAAMSLLLVAVLIIVLFITALAHWEAGLFIVLLFVCCMASLIVSLAAFIRDIQLSLHALSLELETEKPSR
jgi:membrane-associated HD superfamily phosphohydrolase